MVDKFTEPVFWDFWNLFKTVKLSISWSNGIRILILFCRARNYKTLLNISAKFFQIKILIEKEKLYITKSSHYTVFNVIFNTKYFTTYYIWIRCFIKLQKHHCVHSVIHAMRLLKVYSQIWENFWQLKAL